MFLFIFSFSSSAVPTKLFIGNLPQTVRKADLQQVFEGFGQVVECDIVKNFAFVVRLFCFP